MTRLALCLVPVTLLAGQARWARVGDFEGDVQVQIQAADPWQPVLHNMPVGELAWLRTAPGARVELELDDGGAFRLGPDSLAELSDYTRLSTGQRITLISLDQGVAYFTGAADGQDALMLAVPGAQVTVRQGARLRMQAHQGSQIATIDGAVTFSSPGAEFDLVEGQTVRLDPAQPSRFSLFREISPLETDRWSDARDGALVAAASAGHLATLHYGLADLDTQGVWIQSGSLGAVWKPKMPEAWAPFRNGKWMWYDGLGYAWISADSWGWVPYHYGRWMQQEDIGWVWAPGGNTTAFTPGEVYWLKSAKLVGWGPLAPGEDWQPPAVPHLFLNVNTTYAAFAPEAREIDPAGFSSRPQQPLATAAFTVALPSPAFPAARLEAVRPALRAGSTRVVPVLNGVTFEGPPELQEARVPVAPPPPTQVMPIDNGPPAEQPVVIGDAAAAAAAEQPNDSYYPVPVYTGIIVVNPPVHTQAFTHASTQAPTQVSAGGQAKAPAPPPSAPREPPRPKPMDADRPEKPTKN